MNANNSLWKKMQYSVENPYWFMNKLRHRFGRIPNIYDYDKMWSMILRRKPVCNRIFPGAFPAWDNTPRRVIHVDVFWKATPDKFKSYFAKQMKHAKNVYHAEYIFINAWNEWGEGAHLEPDEKNGYGYLEAIRQEKNGRVEAAEKIQISNGYEG